ncbi:MAG: ATP-binding protein, partial [Firmicutes bacterium]|nr:ATP-binding protein [Candidatus Alectryobacillus merdavium]
SILEKIKEIVDRLAREDKDNNGLFWLTGSQKFKMMENVSESLAGRVSLYELSSLSFKEIYGVDDSAPFTPNLEVLKAKKPIPLDVNQVFNNIFKGGMPRIIRNGINREKYYSDYIATYIERDIREMQAVGKLNEFYDFLVFMASRTAQELHYDEIAKKIGISAPTAKEWVSILERSGLIFILRPYYKDITSR